MALKLPNKKKLFDPETVQKSDHESFIEHYWLGLGDTSKIKVENPFHHRTEEEIENPHLFLLGLMRRPEYFYFTCKYVLNKTLPPFQLAILRELWVRPFPMFLGSRGLGKSFLIALYCMLRALLCPGTKIVVVGAAFRQSKVVFDYCADIWDHSPVLRSIVGEDKFNGPRRDIDRCYLRMGESIIIALPLGDGGKIRGQRANIICAEEFAKIPVDIFETVVRGFAAVSNNPIDKLRMESKKDAIRSLGLWTPAHEAIEHGKMMSNQTIISGTCDYCFNHFYTYWKQYRDIVESRGDPKRLADIFHGEVPENFNWKDYCVIRIPAFMLPRGFMDEKQLAHSKVTMNRINYLQEYGAVFVVDSDGFFRRSLIESCVAGNSLNLIEHPSCGQVRFSAVLKGDLKKQYVMAVDPASEKDNFAIGVLELWPEHRRIVHYWTTTRKKHIAVAKAGLTKEQDFYKYAARKIRDLHHAFPSIRIGIDSQGGGRAIIEALHDPANLMPGERPFYEVVDPDKPKDTDGLAGEHIIEIVNFADAKWVSDANHGLRKDLEDKALVFPEFDPGVVALAHEEDKRTGRVTVDQEGVIEKLYDTLEDVVMEIEELKDELASIRHSQTGSSLRDRWDVPETKMPGGKKGRLRKDRYSVLVMANMIARILDRTIHAPEPKVVGGFAKQIARDNVAGGVVPSGPMWIGPSHLTDRLNSFQGVAVRRGGDQ